MTATKPSAAIFIVPRESTAWRGNEAGWITASGWASAGKVLWGNALVATRDGIFTPEEARLFPRGPAPKPRSDSPVRRVLPEFLITGYKDYRLWHSTPASWPIEESTRWKDLDVKLIWERHDLFAGPGRRLADRIHVPLVTSVEAVVVWEAEKWGVRRPFYGRWLEKAEGASLRRADLVLCVSDDVRKKVLSLGIDPTRTMVTPNRVDSTLFHPGVSGDDIRKKYGVVDKRVLGWTGSFRKFHALPSLLSAFSTVHSKHPDTVLMLVGDGQELMTLRVLANEAGLGDAVIFTGRQPFTMVPAFVAAFDLALVTAAKSTDFHYSPLKLREYLALGKAIVAPNAGDLPDMFQSELDLVFYEPGNVSHLASSILRILDNAGLKRKLEVRAKELFTQKGTWVDELSRVCSWLGIKVDSAGQSIPMR